MEKKRNLNKIIAAILSSFIVVTIIAIVFTFLNYNGAFDKKPTVTIKPKDFGPAAETLYVATDHDYEPFSYIEDGEYKGLDVELIAEVANRMEMNLELELLDWEDVQSGLKSGKYQVILNMEANAILRDDDIIGTIPTDEKQYVVYGKTKVKYVGELYGKRVAAYNKFDELGIDVITGYTYQQMFEMLLSNELDYVICPIQVGNSFVDKLGARGEIVSSYQVSYMYGCMALKATDGELCKELNEVIKQLQIEGFIEKLDEKWVTNRYTSFSVQDVLERHPYIIVLIIVAVQMIILAVIFAIIAYSNSKKQKAYSIELQKNIDIINKQNQELVIAHQEAKKASEAKSSFLFNMSHDIRTPMNAIIGFTNLAKKHIGEEALLKDYLAKISTSSELLLGLINDILEMSKIENGKATLSVLPESIIDIMNQIDAILRGQASDKKQELIFENDVQHEYILVDRLKFNQVLINLISNAIKYTNEGGRISVNLKEVESEDSEKAKFIIKIKDNGIGMSEEFQAKIFEPFEREKSTTVSKITGTGLGMSITKSLIELMGGTISLTSKLGEGSEFVVTLEFPITDKPVEETKNEEKVENKKKDDVKYRILVVDDNEVNRIIATEILKDLDYDTDEAEDGYKALEKIKNAKVGDFDLILMDVQMPGIDGYQTTREIRSLDSPLKDIPIIALTANAFSDDKVNAKEAGMNSHIAKPINIEELVAVLDKYLG
ncbi:MAG: response regulator [Bacilli bacterium]|nr:response regulator [Bacilli bacterium]